MRAALLCALLSLALPVLAQDATGRVDAIYFEVAPGVLVTAGALRPANARRWADVDVGGRKVLARLPEELRVGPGDRIAVRVGDRKSSALAQVLPTTTVSRALGPVDPNASIGR
ncbi:MAG TPA: hypothetical protein VG873_10785 [Burkholderiales bacterium]|nr:hypothetical protein [Burkholderiales bacterium]